MGMKYWLKQIVPPVLLTLWQRRNRVVFEGNYPSWQAALADSSGYDQPAILAKVAAATAEVVAGNATFERDSVLFHHEEYNWPLLTGLLTAAAENNNELVVLDFGGALGSCYFQNRKMLQGLKKLCWNIIEQPHFVQCGMTRFASGQLRFYDSVHECMDACPQINVAILSSVFQYLKDPWQCLNEICACNPEYIFFDRTPVTKSTTGDRLCIQKVAASIYNNASYPVWLCSHEKVIENMAIRGYVLMVEFSGFEGHLGNVDFMGMFFSRCRNTAAKNQG